MFLRIYDELPFGYVKKSGMFRLDGTPNHNRKTVRWRRRYGMKLMGRVLGAILLLAFLCSCAVFSQLKTTPDYNAGRKVGESYAAKDAFEIKCQWPGEHTHLDAARKARTYGGPLKEQGRSEDFIHGFYYGYQEVYVKRIGTYCGR